MEPTKKVEWNWEKNCKNPQKILAYLKNVYNGSITLTLLSLLKLEINVKETINRSGIEAKEYVLAMAGRIEFWNEEPRTDQIYGISMIGS